MEGVFSVFLSAIFSVHWEHYNQCPYESLILVTHQGDDHAIYVR